MKNKLCCKVHPEYSCEFCGAVLCKSCELKRCEDRDEHNHKKEPKPCSDRTELVGFDGHWFQFIEREEE
jgi:hypothetical protein